MAANLDFIVRIKPRMELLRKSLTKALDIREGEFLRSFLMFFYLFLVIACQVTAKSVRDSLFLKQIGYSSIPYVYILIAVGGAVISSLYSKASARLDLLSLIRGSSLVAIGVFFLFRLGVGSSGPWVYYLLYIWVSTFGLLAASQFWLLANYIFNAREAKRIFGVIGAGGVLGSVVGGLFTSFGARRFGTENLLWCCMGLVFLTMLILEFVSRTTAVQTEIKSVPLPSKTETTRVMKLLRLIWESRHLRMTTAILGIGVMCEAFADYQIKYISAHTFDSRDQLTSFFGTLQVYLGAFAFLFQLFCTGRILKHFGVGVSLLFQPLGILAGSLYLTFSQTLLAAGCLKVSDGTFRYSIQRAGIELLYLPVPQQLKNRAKGFLDVFVDRFGGGVAGLALILLANQLKLTIPQLSLLVCGMIGVWLYLTVQARKEYLNSFRLALERKSIEPDTLSFPLYDSETVRHLLEVLGGNDERQVLYAIKLLGDAPPELWFPRLELLLEHDSPKVRAVVLEHLSTRPQISQKEKVEAFLKDPDLTVRTEAVHYLTSMAVGPAEKKMQPFLNSPDFATVGGAIQCIARYQENPDRFISRELIENAMAEKGRQRKDARIAAATALSLLEPDSSLLDHLASLLEDSCVEVVRSAIQTCGKIRSRPAIPKLIAMLALRHLRSEVRESLARYGNMALHDLCSSLYESSSPISVRANIPGVLAGIGTQEAVDGLLQALTQSDHFLGYRIIKALNKMREMKPDLRFNPPLIDSLVLEEINAYSQYAKFLCSGEPKPSELPDSLKLLCKALEEKLDQKIERMFRLLHLRYPPKDIYYAYNAVASKKPGLRASAIEFLDNLLLPPIKQVLLPILDEMSMGSLLARQRPPLMSRRENQVAAIRNLLTGADVWLKTLAFYAAATLKLRELLPEIQKATNDPNPIVNEMASGCLTSLSGT